MKQWDCFTGYHWGDLAHSTHLRGGGGIWDTEHGELDRVTVTLATGIPEVQVREGNLDHLDPAAVDVAAWATDADTLVVPARARTSSGCVADGSVTRRPPPAHASPRHR